ncbi:hypothetical protein QA646_25235 (plasmid) [Rhizobium sp. CB3090]|uniref:hypothetical protein n=1 Tax=Rhizobium sp. CB3090 TaxID=3039156 RepID=UPI0024B2646A|nr:hypothetical protein [Rhizobium sp. CB3090]WFU11687.1 hypothetical protein QA646_25235 [Rhizobium sp. CB3090]
MRTILSWSATAGMIIDASQKSLVPEGFTKLSLARCRSEIDSLSQQLAQTSQQDLSAQAAGLNKIIEAAEEDIDSGRRDDASKHIADLQRMEENLKARSGAAQ